MTALQPMERVTPAAAYCALSDARATIGSTFGRAGYPGYSAFYYTADRERWRLDVVEDGLSIACNLTLDPLPRRTRK